MELFFLRLYCENGECDIKCRNIRELDVVIVYFSFQGEGLVEVNIVFKKVIEEERGEEIRLDGVLLRVEYF